MSVISNPMTVLISDGGYKNTLDSLIDRSITTVSVSEGVTTVGNTAFYGCANLTEAVLSSTVASVGGYGFLGCTSLARLKILNPSAVVTIRSSTFTGSSLTDGTCEGVYVPDALCDSYRIAPYWSAFAALIRPLSQYPS